MKLEKRIQDKIIKYMIKLEKEGYPVYYERRNAIGFNYKAGVADVYIIVNGIHIEIEIKKIGGELSTMQEKWKEECKRKNIIYKVFDNENNFKIYVNKILKI